MTILILEKESKRNHTQKRKSKQKIPSMLNTTLMFKTLAPSWCKCKESQNTFKPVALIFSANWSTATLLGAQTNTLTQKETNTLSRIVQIQKKKKLLKKFNFYLSLTLFGHVIYNSSRCYSFSSARGSLDQTYGLLKDTLYSENLARVEIQKIRK